MDRETNSTSRQHAPRMTLGLGGMSLPWCPLSEDRLAQQGGQGTRMAAGSTKPRRWGDDSCADPDASLGAHFPRGAPAGNVLPKRGDRCAPLARSREAQKVSRDAGLALRHGELEGWWQRYQGQRSHQGKFGGGGGETGISAHSPCSMQRAVHPRCWGGCRWRKEGAASLLLLEECPHTSRDIWQDGRCSSLLRALTVLTAVVAGTATHS